MGLLDKAKDARQQWRETEVRLPDGSWESDSKKIRAAFKADKEARKDAKKKR